MKTLTNLSSHPDITLLMVILLLLLHTPAHSQQQGLLLVDPTQPIDQVWEQRGFGNPTRYQNQIIDGYPVISATGTHSAAGLFRNIRFAPRERPILEWRWRVDQLPQDANIRHKQGDDVGASIYLIFGRTGWFRPEPPTLVYSWSSAHTAAGSIIKNPYHSNGAVRTLVLRSGTDELGRWVAERRNIIEDYRRVFGEEPPATVEMVAIWSDGDQTQSKVKAYYGAVQATSNPGR